MSLFLSCCKVLASDPMPIICLLITWHQVLQWAFSHAFIQQKFMDSLLFVRQLSGIRNKSWPQVVCTQTPSCSITQAFLPDSWYVWEVPGPLHVMVISLSILFWWNNYEEDSWLSFHNCQNWFKVPFLTASKSYKTSLSEDQGMWPFPFTLPNGFMYQLSD